MPVGVAHQLDLDVASRQDLALEVDRPIAEGSGCLGGSGGEGGRQVVARRDATHAPSATAGRRLDEQRIADARGLGREGVHAVGPVDRSRLEGARDNRYAGLAGQAARRELVAERGDRVRVRADEDQSGRFDGAGE